MAKTNASIDKDCDLDTVEHLPNEPGLSAAGVTEAGVPEIAI